MTAHRQQKQDSSQYDSHVPGISCDPISRSAQSKPAEEIILVVLHTASAWRGFRRLFFSPMDQQIGGGNHEHRNND